VIKNVAYQKAAVNAAYDAEVAKQTMTTDTICTFLEDAYDDFKKYKNNNRKSPCATQPVLPTTSAASVTTNVPGTTGMPPVTAITGSSSTGTPGTGQ
jgi:hypothetical protein